MQQQFVKEHYSTDGRGYNKKPVKFVRHNTAIGNIGENHVKQLLKDSGYLAKKRRKKRFSGDLWTYSTQTRLTHNIEVKTANESQSGTYHFCLKKDGHTDICHSDFLFLVCIDRYGNKFVYAMPCAIIVTANLSITSHPLRYEGKYQKFRVYGQVNLDEIAEIASW